MGDHPRSRLGIFQKCLSKVRDLPRRLADIRSRGPNSNSTKSGGHSSQRHDRRARREGTPTRTSVSDASQVVGGAVQEQDHLSQTYGKRDSLDVPTKKRCQPPTEQTVATDISRSNISDERQQYSDPPHIEAALSSHVSTNALSNASGEDRSEGNLPDQPNENAKRYIMRREQYHLEAGSDSTELLVAPVSQDRQARDDPPGSSDPGDEIAAMAPDIKSDGTFRCIHIRYDHDPEGNAARTQYIMHDTGAGCSLTFESKLKALGLDFERIDWFPNLYSVTGEAFRPIGRRQICFSYHKRSEKKHWTDLVVLSDPISGMEPNFDILFGRDTIKKVRAINWDPNVIGHVHGHMHFPSLFMASPRHSISTRRSEDAGSAAKAEISGA